MLAKICGLTNHADAAQAVEAGADLLGFVVHPQSPRHCADLPAAVRGHVAQAVLVTVGQDAEAMMTLGHLVGLRRIQPHVPREHRKAVVETLLTFGFWVLLPWTDDPDQPELPADLYLWEPSPVQTGVVGGSGQTHAMAYPPPGPFLLAGGLDGSNLRQRFAMIPREARSLAEGADAASRLERAPGLKDPQKVRAFVEAVKKIKNTEAADYTDYTDKKRFD